MLNITGGNGAEQVIDFVGEGGSTSKGLDMTRRAGDYHAVGHGENVDIPTTSSPPSATSPAIWSARTTTWSS